jgi:hypothetical protein
VEAPTQPSFADASAKIFLVQMPAGDDNALPAALQCEGATPYERVSKGSRKPRRNTGAFLWCTLGDFRMCALRLGRAHAHLESRDAALCRCILALHVIHVCRFILALVVEPAAQ